MTSPDPLTEAHELAGRKVARGAARPSERALAPDLARGAMLLLIVVSNTGFHLWAARYGASGRHPVDGSGADAAVQFATITALDGRIYPLFAFLLGYGMTQLLRRQVAAGATERAATALLRRRSGWLVVFGFVHAALLLGGDIVGYYGVVSLVLGWLFLRRRDRTLLVAAAVMVVLELALDAPALWALAGGDLGGAGAPAAAATLDYAAGEEDALAAAATRLSTWSILVLLSTLLWLISPELLLGFWAARRGVLEDPRQHLRLLRRTALLGVSIGWLGGLPLAVAHVGWWRVPGAAVGQGGTLSTLAELTGLAGGLGYVAVFGLLAHGLAAGARSSRAVVAVAAVGRRSLSCYLAHSLMFAPVLSAWGLGLGAELGSASMAAFAVAVWLVTVAAAYALELRGRTGPAEALLRRLVYGRRPAAPPIG